MIKAYKNHLLLGLLLFALAGGAVFWYYVRTPKLSTLRWKVGDKQAYSFVSRNIVHSYSMNGNVSAGSMQNHRFQLEGILNFKVFDVQGGRIRAGLQFYPIKVKSGGRESPAYTKLFSQLFYVDFTPSGKFQKIYFSNTIAKADEAIIESALYQLQLNIPQQPKQTWVADESDKLGSYSAEYNWDRDLVKQKLEYQTVLANQSAINISANIKVARSNVRINYTQSHSWVLAVNGSELIVVTNNKGSKLKLSNWLEMKLIPFSKAEQSIELWNEQHKAAEQIAHWAAQPKEKLSLAQIAEIDRLENQYGTQDLFQFAQKQFEHCEKFNGNCVNKFINYFKLLPHAALQAVDVLRQFDLNGEQQAMLINALQSAQTDQAQTALRTIMQGSDFTEKSRLQATIALGDSMQASPETVSSLWSTYEQEYDENGITQKISDNAALALGRIARRFSYGDDASLKQYEKIREKLKLELAKVEQPGRLTSVMYAAANSGDEDFIPELVDYIESDVPRFRAAAAQALGIYESEEIDTHLAKMLRDDTDPKVRSTVMKSVIARDAADETLKEVCEQIKREDNDIVKGEMYKFLLAQRKDPLVRKTLKEMSLVETSLQNKKIISRALASKK